MFHPGRETPVTVGSKRWTVGRLTGVILLTWRDWIAAQIGDPYEAVERVKPYLSADELLKRVAEAESTAKDLKQFSLGTATARSWLKTELGVSKLLHLMMQAKHPDCTEDDAFTVAMELGMKAAAQAVHDGAGEVPADPNGQAAATGGSTGMPSAAG